jgi:hypothetical protein
MKDLLDVVIDEMAYGEIMRKQKSITYLFPPFRNRVKTVANKGGIRLDRMTPGLWKYRVKSASQEDHWYDVYLHWKNIENAIKKHTPDMRLWKKDKSGVDLRRLAVEVMFDTDLEVYCSCPADLYWGGQYIRTQRHAKYTRPENRPPVVRNPKQYGLMCKHLQLVFDLFPAYATTMAGYLNRVYRDDIEAAEGEARKKLGLVRQAAQFLKKKEGEEKDEKEKEMNKKLAKEEEPEKEEKPEGEEETKESVRRFCHAFIK